jgi:predicted transposase
MEQTLTIVCKLQPTPEQAAKMDDLLRAFADACNYANEQVKPGITSKTTIQGMVYQDIRAQFGLRVIGKILFFVIYRTWQCESTQRYLVLVVDLLKDKEPFLGGIFVSCFKLLYSSRDS